MKSKLSTKLIFILLISIISLSGVLATNYFASTSTGSDSNSGTDSGNAIKTFGKYNTITKQTRDKFYLLCGDTFNLANDTRFLVTNGNSTQRFEFNAYGSCVKDANNFTTNMPRIVAANFTSSSACWTNTTSISNANIWKWTCGNPPYQVGRIIGNGSQNISTKPGSYELGYNWSVGELTSDAVQGRYYSNDTSNEIWIYSIGNPITYYSNLILVFRYRLIYDSVNSWVEFHNLSLEYGADHGLDLEDSVTNVIVSYMDCHDVGGGYFDVVNKERYGNCFQFYRNNSNNEIHHNRCWEDYDACYTNQESTNAANFLQSNVTFQYNLCMNSSYCYEYFQSDTGSKAQNITYISNTAFGAGLGWYRTQRKNSVNPGIYGNCIRLGDGYNTSDVEIKNNLCMESDQFAFRARTSWTDLTGNTSAWKDNKSLYMDHNLWFRNKTKSYSRESQALIYWLLETNVGGDVDDDRYSTIDAFKLEGKETGSRNESTNFSLQFPMDLRPSNGSLACTMSETGSFVGALPCFAGSAAAGSNATTSSNLNIPTAISINVTPLAYLPFDSNTGGNDTTGNGNNCGLNSTTSTSSGFVGQAYYLDGVGDYMECKNTNAWISINYQREICMAMKFSTSVANDNDRVFRINKSYGTARLHEIFVGDSLNQMAFTKQNSSGSDSTLRTKNTPDIGSWQYYCMHENTTGWYLWKNGTQINETQTGRDLNGSTFPVWYLGALGPSPTANDANVSLDEIMIINNSLSKTQESTNYNNLKLYGIRNTDLLNTTTNINVTSLNNNSIYTCGDISSVPAYWNTSRVCYNSSGSSTLTCTDSTSSCVNLTGLTASTLYTISRYEIADNGINTTIGALISNTTDVSTSCGCTSGNCNFNLGDSCVINSNLNLGNITFTGTGSFTCNSTLNANITFCKATGCNFNVAIQCRIRGKYR